jgi:hypothetical protein
MIKFEITEDHIKVISSLYIKDGDILLDKNDLFNGYDKYRMLYTVIYGVRDIVPPNHKGSDKFDYITNDFKLYCDKLLLELNTVLEIVLQTKKFESGIYKTKSYEKNWKKYEI